MKRILPSVPNNGTNPQIVPKEISLSSLGSLFIGRNPEEKGTFFSTLPTILIIKQKVI